MPTTPVTVERHATAAGAPVDIVTVASPPLNLFGHEVFDALADALARLTADPPRAVVIQAEGKVVSGGVDVHVFDGLDAAQGQALWEDLFARVIHPLEALPCPVVFAAHALTLTAAFEVALACDLLVAAPKAKFGLVETVVGLTPSMGGPQRLAERAGPARARELVMTAGLYDAATLHAWGVVNIVDEDAHGRARALADTLADGPTRAHAATKEIVQAWRLGGVPYADSTTPAVSGELFATGDLRGAVRSFLDNGPGKATYRGR